MVTVEQLRTSIKQSKTRAIVFDADNTLFRTSEVFFKNIAIAANTIGVERRLIDDCVMGTRSEFNVNPIIVHYAVMLAAKQAGYNIEHKLVQEALTVIDDIYTCKTEVFDGVFELLEMLMYTQADLYLATHATPEYTGSKIRQVGLHGKFKTIYNFNVLRPKSAQWDDFYKETRIDPLTSIVVGDDLRADVVKPAFLGSRTCLVDNGLGKTFSPETISANIGDVRYQPLMVDFIGNLATVLVDKLREIE